MTNEELVAEIQQGIKVKDNMQQLYMQNKPLISKFVKPYSEYAEYDDLMQEAYFGLQKAVEHYEVKEGAMFISYAMYWIKSAVSRYASDNGNTKRISNHMVQKIYRYRKFLGQYARVNQGFPTDDVICKELEINQRSLNSIRKTIHEMNCMSIDETVPGADELLVGDTIADGVDIENTIVESTARQKAAIMLWNMVEQLPERQKSVLIDRYKKNMTLEQIGEQQGVTKERIRQLEVKGIDTLKKKTELKAIAAVYDYFPGAYKGGVGRFKNTGTSSTEYCAMKRVDTMQKFLMLRAEMDAMFGITRDSEGKKYVERNGVRCQI